MSPTTPCTQSSWAWHAQGLGSVRFARRYSGHRCFFLFLRVLRCFNSPRSRPTTMHSPPDGAELTRTAFPHSEILGSKVVYTSPRLIAADHVLLRLSAPRHPPHTLSSLTTKSVARIRVKPRIRPPCRGPADDPPPYGDRDAPLGRSILMTRFQKIYSEPYSNVKDPHGGLSTANQASHDDAEARGLGASSKRG